MTTFKRIITKVLLLLAITLEFVASTPQWLTASDGNKYLIETASKYNFLQANGECARQNLQMVVIDNADKNAAFVQLLLSMPDKPRDLWLGITDEFSQDVDRPFYSVSTGQEATFSNWQLGEPSNNNKREHCVHTYIPRYEWGDVDCDNRFYGYACEENHLITKYQKDLEQKRQAVYEKNLQISAEFQKQDNEIKEIVENTRGSTTNILNNWKESVDKIIEELQISIDLAIQQKQRSIDQVNLETQKLIDNEQWHAENSTNVIASEHSANLANNQNDINEILKL